MLFFNFLLSELDLIELTVFLVGLAQRGRLFL